MIKKCLMCGKEFVIPRCRQHTAKYCSHQCHSAFSTCKILTTCKNCKREFPILFHDKKKRKFCSTKCHYEYGFSTKHKENISKGRKNFLKANPQFSIGSNNSYWKGGKTRNKKGYTRIYSPEHPFNCNKYVLEHRLIMEKHLGRYLKPQEVVHHINEKPYDNRIENLKLFTTTSEHSKTHYPKGSPVCK
jgi:hypothetical protein